MLLVTGILNGIKTMWIKGLELFAGPNDSITESHARAYIKDMKLTSEDVRLIRRNNMILVVLKRDIDGGSGGD